MRRGIRPAGIDVDAVFTTDPGASPVHVTSWGFMGDTWPYFRPNYTNMDAYREKMGASEVCGC
jgi:DNA ligase 1